MYRRPARGLPQTGEEAVSPVVGMILVLAVSVVGITGVLFWGLPAVEDMRASVESRSMQSQYLQLISEIEELEAGTAGRTAKRWQPSMQSGSILINATTERWAFSYDKKDPDGTPQSATYNFTWGSVADTDNVIYIENLGSAFPQADISLKAYRLDATLQRSILILQSDDSSTYTQPSALTGLADSEWKRDQEIVFYLREADGTQSDTLNIYSIGLHVEIYHEGSLVSELFVLDMGKVHHSLPTSGGERELLLTAGGYIQGTNGNYVFLNSPPIPPPKNASGIYRMFSRAVQIDGSAQAAGADRFDVLLNLYGTDRLVDLRCEESDKSDCAQNIRIYPLGTFGSVWRSYFLDSSNGYNFVAGTNDFTADPGNGLPSDAKAYVMDWQGDGISFTLLQSVITVTGR